VQCNGTTYPFSVSHLVITGKSSQSLIIVSGVSLVLVLSNVPLSGSSRILTSQSSVLLSLNSSSTISNSPTALECASTSNLTVTSLHDDSLLVISGSSSVAIGSSPNSACDFLSILNGSLTVSGGIGSARVATTGSISHVNNLVIHDGAITASGTSTGAGIGTGQGQPGTSKIGTMAILNGTIIAFGFEGAGIGCGRSMEGGNARIDDLLIVNGKIEARSTGNAAGSGYPAASGLSWIANLSILDGNIIAESSSGAIGSGRAYLESSYVTNLLIMNGNITATGKAAIGSGTDSGGRAYVNNLVIGGGNITASTNGGLAVIGRGNTRYSDAAYALALKFSGEVFLRCSSNSANPPILATSTEILDGSIVVIETNQDRVFPSSPTSSGNTDLTILSQTWAKRSCTLGI
jgi:hypothetical protein